MAIRVKLGVKVRVKRIDGVTVVVREKTFGSSG